MWWPGLFGGWNQSKSPSKKVKAETQLGPDEQSKSTAPKGSSTSAGASTAQLSAPPAGPNAGRKLRQNQLLPPPQCGNRRGVPRISFQRSFASKAHRLRGRAGIPRIIPAGGPSSRPAGGSGQRAAGSGQSRREAERGALEGRGGGWVGKGCGRCKRLSGWHAARVAWRRQAVVTERQPSTAAASGPASQGATACAVAWVAWVGVTGRRAPHTHPLLPGPF